MARRHRGSGAHLAVTLALVLAFVCTPARSHSQRRTSTPSAYAEAIETYRAGRFDDAVAAARWIPTLDLKSLAHGRAWPDPSQLAAAVMLHSEVYMSAEMGGAVSTSAQAHVAVAESLAGRLTPKDSARFLLTWHLMMASHTQCHVDPDTSERILRLALRLFPGNGEILMALGAAHESRSTVGFGPSRVTWRTESRPIVRRDRFDVEDELRGAERRYREALAAQPDLDEARLRLGRVQHQRGGLDEAAATLTPLLSRKLHPALAYLARLFLASVLADQDRRREAADLYVQALELNPGGQAGFIGLSALLYADNQPAPSEVVLGRFFDADLANDPYWAYIQGECWHLSTRLANARALATSTP
jgi:tetratricopeptide repeat protein